MELPSLLELCIQAAASGNHWTVQRRSLERLPDHAANELLAKLLARQTSGPIQPDSAAGGTRAPVPLAPLRPATLELFRFAVTRVALKGAAVSSDWLAVLGGFSNLEELQLCDCSKLTDASLQFLLQQPTGSSPATAPAANPAALKPSTSPPTGSSPADSGPWRVPQRSLRQPGATSRVRTAGGSSPGAGATSASRCTAASSSTLATTEAGTGDPAGAGASGGVSGSNRPSAAAVSLRVLDLSGSRRLGDSALASMAECRNLTALNISETGVQGPSLNALAELTALTRLQAGGLQGVQDAAWCGCLHPLTRLQHLELWGSGAGGGPDGGEGLMLVLACLPQLRHLNLAWTPTEVLPAFPGLQMLDMSYCRLREVWWPTGRPEEASLALKQLVLRGATVSGSAASSQDNGLAAVVRHAAPTLEALDLREVRSADPWVIPLTALVEGGGAPSLTQLYVSHSVVRPEDLELLQVAPLLQRLAAAGTPAGSPRGAAALVSAELRQLQDLDLKSSGVTDDSALWLQQLTGLTQLGLAGNALLTLAPLAPVAPRAGFGPPRLPPPGPPGAAADVDAPRGPAAAAQAAPEVEDIWAPEAVPRGRAGAAAGPEALGDDVEAAAEGRTAAVAAAPEDSNSGGTLSCLWPRLRKLDLLGTAVGEAGLRALCVSRGGCDTTNVAAVATASTATMVGPGAGAGSGDGRGEGTLTSSSLLGGATGRTDDSSAGGAAANAGGPLAWLELLKIGGSGFTDAAAGVLGAAGPPRLHSLLVRDAPLSAHGARDLAAGCPSLRRLELQGCWLVPEQEAAALAEAMAASAPSVKLPVSAVVNGKALTTTTAAVAKAASTGRGGQAGRGSGGLQGRGPLVSGAGAGDGARSDVTGKISYRADLELYDQRLRYSREELLKIAESPWVPCGAAGRQSVAADSSAGGVEDGGVVQPAVRSGLGAAGPSEALLQHLAVVGLGR